MSTQASHAPTLANKTDHVGSRMPLSFLVKEIPCLMCDLVLCLIRGGHDDRRIRVCTELQWNIPSPEWPRHYAGRKIRTSIMYRMIRGKPSLIGRKETFDIYIGRG